MSKQTKLIILSTLASLAAMTVFEFYIKPKLKNSEQSK